MRIIYGMNPVLEALSSRDVEVRRVLMVRSLSGGKSRRAMTLAGARGAEVVFCSIAEIAKLAGTSKNQGILAEVNDFRYASLDDILERWKRSDRQALIVLLEGVQDPRNLGSIIRTAEVLGVHGVILPRRRAAGITPAVAKASAGAIEHMAIARVVNISNTIDKLKTLGIWVIGSAVTGEKDVFSLDLRDNMAIVMGGEEKGLGPKIRKKCDDMATIPMKGMIHSMNVAVATGIFLYEAIRQREKK